MKFYRLSKISLDLIHEEYRKISASMSKQTYHILIISNGKLDFDRKSIPMNLSLVSKENFVDFFGSTLATRAEFGCLTPEINLNTATLVELQCLEGIGIERATKIIARRQEIGSFTSLDKVPFIEFMGRENVCLSILR